MADGGAFDFFRQETSNSDVVIRSESMLKLLIIAALMPADKVRSEMIPYLISKLKDADQVLLALAKKIGSIVQFMGGPEYSPALIPIFESLSETEEASIRLAATNSIKKVLGHLSPSAHHQQAQSYLDLFKRICNDENGDVFYPRVSAGQMLPDIYRIVSDADKPVVRELLNKLAKDEYVLVRQAAVFSIVEIADLADVDILCGEFFQLMRYMVTDEHQHIRVHGVEQFVSFIVVLKKRNGISNLLQELLPLIKSTYEDPSWKIRLAFVRNFGNLATCFEPGVVTTDVFPGVIHFLQDPEPEVRTKALACIHVFLPIVGPSGLLNDFSPNAVILVADPVASVRKALADASVEIAAKVGPEFVAQHISEIVSKIMADDDPMVRLRIIRKLPLMAEENPSLCTRLTDVLKTAFSDPNWRVRKEIILAMPAVIRHMGKDFFAEHFLPLFLKQLKDGVCEVRGACSTAIPLMALAGSSEFVAEKMYSTIRSLSAEEYLFRLSLVGVLEGLLKVDSLSEKFRMDLVNLLVTAASDKVPNIRLRAAQAISSISKSISPEIMRAQLKPLLDVMQADKDKDVKYFATVA